MSRRRKVRLGWFGVLFLTLSGCASSKLDGEWRDATDAGAAPLRNLYVIAVKRDPIARRIWEDTFVTQLIRDGAQARASYRDFPDALPDTLAVVAKVREVGYDGVLVADRIGSDTRQVYVPGTTRIEPSGWYRDWSGRYVESTKEISTPGYTETEKLVYHEATVWRTREGGKIIWAGRIETTNPESPQDVSKELAKIVMPKLKKAGIL
jgi:hypothetical protein